MDSILDPRPLTDWSYQRTVKGDCSANVGF